MKISRYYILLVFINIAIAISFGAMYLQAVNDGILIITPSQGLRPGDLLKFSAVFDNVTDYPKGDKGFLLVAQEKGLGWISEKQHITMPNKDKPINIKFKKNYTIPKLTKSETSYCFRLMLGGDNFASKIPISEIVCVSIAPLQGQTSPGNANKIKILPETLSDLAVNYVKIDEINPTHAKIHIRNQSDIDSPSAKIRIELSRFNTPPFSTFIFNVPAMSKNSGAWINIETEKPIGTACDCTVKICIDSSHSINYPEGTANCWQKNFASQWTDE